MATKKEEKEYKQENKSNLKDKVIIYFENQITLKIAQIEAFDVPTNKSEEVSKEATFLRRELFDLQRHKEVIKLL